MIATKNSGYIMPGLVVCKSYTASCMNLKSVGEGLHCFPYLCRISVQVLTTNKKIHVGNVNVNEHNRLQEQRSGKKPSSDKVVI
jgi:hypothetical protein